MSTHPRNTVLLATDQQRSVLSALKAHEPHPIAYSPYGHRPAENVLLSLLGFNGEPPDPLTGCYHLGNGYRQFNPVLMRFNSPDSWSPFGGGGLNAYAYCGGDPVGRVDPSGHAFGFLKAIGRNLGLRTSAKAKYADRMNDLPSNKLKASSLFTDERLIKSAKLGEPSLTHELRYLEKTNSLHLARFVENDKFSFTSLIKINSRSRPLSQETLISITPNQDLKTLDPKTFQYVADLQKKIKTYGGLSNVEINETLHPILQQQNAALRTRLDNYRNEPRSKSDPNRFLYRSGGGG
jgi:RHS repeat-associated protein